MTIQLPILLWTLITFALAMLILNRLLFRPMLVFMDKRQAKIDRAKTVLSERAELEKEAATQTELHRKEAQHINAETAAAEKKKKKTRADGIVKKAETEREIALAAGHRDALYREKELSDKLNQNVDTLARALCERLLSDPLLH